MHQMLKEIPTHPNDPLTALVPNRDAFLNIYQNQFKYHGAIWHDAGRAHAYRDLFNNEAGVRKRFDDLFDKLAEGRRDITATFKRGKDAIIYLDDRNRDCTTSVENALSHCPQLKQDFEFGVRNLWHETKEGVTIWWLSDYPNVEGINPRRTLTKHVDPTTTFYLQCGGVPLQCISKDLAGMRLGEYEEIPDEILETIMDKDIYSIESGDFLMMRGTNGPSFTKAAQNILAGQAALNDNPMAHFRDADQVNKHGRLNISIFADRWIK